MRGRKAEGPIEGLPGCQSLLTDIIINTARNTKQAAGKAAFCFENSFV